MLDDIEKEIKAIKLKLNRAIVCGHTNEVTRLSKQYELAMSHRRCMVSLIRAEQWLESNQHTSGMLRGQRLDMYLTYGKSNKSVFG